MIIIKKMNFFLRRIRVTNFRNIYSHGNHSHGEKSSLKMPANPTIYGSFGSKVSKEEMDRIMDPKGFLDYDE